MSEPRYFKQKTGNVYTLGGDWEYHNGGSIRDYDDVEVQVVPLDAIVIDRADLPEVVSRSGSEFNTSSGDALDFDTAEEAESFARSVLAVADELRNHPVVDEEQVRLVDMALEAASLDGISLTANNDTLARYLVAQQGVRVEGGE